MKHLLSLLLIAASAFAQTATITDTISTPFGGTFNGTVTVSLNSPALAQPLYSGSVTLSGWTQTVTVTSGAFSLTLYTNDQITPTGTSYSATFAPASGSGWKETWVVPSGATSIREIRSTTVPSPSVKFNLSQLNQNGATLGQGLRWNGSAWAPGTFVADPMTATGDLITRSGGVAVRVPIGTTGQILTVTGGLPAWATNFAGNAATATALAADPANCSAGTLPRGVDASGAGQGCAAVSLTADVTGTLPNANTTATSANSASAIVARDGSGNFSAGTVTAALSGNASTATTLATARNIAGVSFNGSADIAIPYSGLTGAPALAAVATSGSASDLASGTLAAARGGAGTVSGLLKANGAGVVSAAVAGTDFVVPAGNVATATALATARTIAGVSFNGSADIAIPSTGLSDSANLVRNNQANTYTAGTKQTFASNATTAGAAFSGGITADPSSVAAGDFWYRADLGTFGFRNASAVDALVAGGRALTTVGAVPFVTSSGVLGQSSNLAFDNANNRFALGSATALRFTTDLSLSRASAGVLQIGDGGSNANGMVRAALTSTISSSNGTAPLFVNGVHTRFISNVGYIESVEAGTSGRELIIRGDPLRLGNSNSGVDFVTLSSAGTFTLLNPAPTVGVTQMIIQAGAGQSGTALQEWRNSGGSALANVTAGGDIYTSANLTGASITVGAAGAALAFWGGSSNDAFLRRRAAGLLAIDSGTAIGTTPGNARDVMARQHFMVETSSDPSAADLSIAGGNAQDVASVYVKNDKLVVAYNRSGTVNYLTIPLDGATTTFTQSTTAP